ncbi:MAG: hypothetical protein K9N35_01060 [Candidatus Marinimicrobia bacterium]|nr:hypothetical protein [Candidatus Neomarinimicrobiota bacterium]
MKNALIKNPQHHEWLAFISRLGLVNINNAREIFLSGDYTQLMDLGQKALYTTGRGKTLSLEGNLLGSKITFDEAQLIAETRNAEGNYPPKDEILAYVHYERAVFWEKYSEHLSSLSLFRSAKRMAVSDSLNSIIDFQIFALQLRNGTGGTIAEAIRWLDYFSKNEMPIMELVATRELAKYYRNKGEFNKSITLLVGALERAIDYNYSFMAEQIKNSYGFTLYKIGKIREAREIFDSLLSGVESKHLRSTILENMTLSYYDEEKYDEASEYISRAIENSQKYDILSQLPDECLFLGDLYREKLQQPELATYYYDIGSAAALKMAEHGFSLKGERLQVVKRFENRSKIGYSIPESLGIVMEPFAFAIGRSWKEINDLFQYHLIKAQLSSGTDISDLPDKFDLKSSTYYAIKRRLGQHGYHLDQDNSDTLDPLGKNHLSALKKYVLSFLDLNWAEANQRFEKEIIEYLFKHVGYQKTKLADELDVSYPTILQKTRSLIHG